MACTVFFYRNKEMAQYPNSIDMIVLVILACRLNKKVNMEPNRAQPNVNTKPIKANSMAKKKSDSH